ncbi:MAG: thiamine diphosphokinase [Clostridia bacterium]|nr:thiamine diphosphokinase [Clostridia bacterium]
MSRCVIVSGAEIGDYAAVRKYFKNDDFNIFCDCGLRHQKELGIKANLIVGDFDSYTRPDTAVETMVLPCEKDDTDTVFAVKEGIKRGFSEFLIVGAIGQRFDHTLGNLYILDLLDSADKNGVIVDDYSEMELVSKTPKYIDDSFSFFSLLNITGEAKGITIKNAKYPLDNAEIKTSYQYGISNEVLKGVVAEVSVKCGKLLLIKVK